MTKLEHRSNGECRRAAGPGGMNEPRGQRHVPDKKKVYGGI